MQDPKLSVPEVAIPALSAAGFKTAASPRESQQCYLTAVGEPFDEDAPPGSPRDRLLRGMQAIHVYEQSLSLEMLRVLQEAGADVYGIRDPKQVGQRVPTFLFNLDDIPPATVAIELARKRIGVRDGHMYSPRLIRRLGLKQETGAVRASLVHYNTVEEVRRFGEVLREIRANHK